MKAKRLPLLFVYLFLSLVYRTDTAAAGDLLFADGFQSGDTSQWSDTVGLAQPCAVGLAVSGALGGDLGAPPAGAFDQLVCLEARNDLAFERLEAVHSGIPLAASQNLLTTDDLLLVGPGERRIASQFRVLSRWGGAPDDASRPIRWLEVTAPVRVAADDTTTLSLRRYDTPTPPTDDFAASITSQGPLWVVDTGLATFTLNPANAALFDAMAIDLDNDGMGHTTIYNHTPGAGPRLQVDGNTLDTAGVGEVSVDADGFRIIESGPVRVTVALQGHFSGPGGSTLCSVDGGSYERFGYTLVASFERASRDVLWSYHLRNECSDGFGASWTDEAVTVEAASLELPFSLSTPTSHFAGSGDVTDSTAGFTGLTVVEQRKGAGSPWFRRARIALDGVAQESGEAFEQPMVAVSDEDVVVAGHLAWMRFREPQALAVDDRTLSLRIISEPLVVGEGKGIWNQGRISLRPAEPDINALPPLPPTEELLQRLRRQATEQLERGLMLRAPLAAVNEAALFASMGQDSDSAVTSADAAQMADLHDDTVLPGGQWDRAKSFGSQLWPEVQLDGAAITNATPFDHNSAMNYWNPSGAELLEFLRSGDPRWLWDFALPESWLQIYTAYLNVGDQLHSNRNGLAVNSGGTGEGQWHRSAFGSDDYTYDLGQHLAYALRPTPNHLERFRQAGRTVVDRYSVPQSQQGMREQFVNQVDLTRQVVQHFEMLANCAEFVPGADGDACRARLHEIVAELAEDNLAAGMMCQGDIPSPTFCSQPQQFMQNAHMYHFLHRYLRTWGDPDGNLQRALVEGPLNHYIFGLPKLGNGTSIDVVGDWAARLECDLTGGGTTVTDCVLATDSDNNTAMFVATKPHTAALLLMAQELDPTIGMCQIVRDAYDAMDLPLLWSDFNGDNTGWWKGAAQMMQGMVFGVGVYESCADPASP